LTTRKSLCVKPLTTFCGSHRGEKFLNFPGEMD